MLYMSSGYRVKSSPLFLVKHPLYNTVLGNIIIYCVCSIALLTLSASNTRTIVPVSTMGLKRGGDRGSKLCTFFGCKRENRPNGLLHTETITVVVKLLYL